ncbi:MULTISPECIES: histidinol-phosphatase [unclassified Rhizobium]|uniref:histidinol-phosphatase n=1 Tax=unclassified Rhizobium TaxID=2613769 RepID=UPI000BE92457|nr:MULTISPECIES: histidinol-phosphatase [unclassified Rhizobium]MDF0661690.1 histidinol-phosphatase [Rhizobium sp. BC49]PDS87512.1 histidinol-phosphatase [Rhizobium sp. L18]
MKLPTADFLHRLADLADRETVSRFRKPLETTTKPKEGYRFDPVTEADREAELAMRALISEEFPGHSIVGEEYGLTGTGACQWVLDPIDGTRPFLLGIPVWGTLIGFCEQGRSTAGMMSQPITRERFWAYDGESWLKTDNATTRLRTSTCAQLSDAVLHTNSPEGVRRNPDVRFDVLDEAVKMTRYGGECYAFAMLAAGHIDICVEFSLQPYDIVSLIPLIESAGGVVTTFDGSRAENGGRIIASANKDLHAAAISILTGGR